MMNVTNKVFELDGRRNLIIKNQQLMCLNFVILNLKILAVDRWGGTDPGRRFSILVQDGYKNLEGRR